MSKTEVKQKQETKHPKRTRPRPPFEERPQKFPGLDAKMQVQADHGEKSYRGHGRLAGKTALITGGDSGGFGTLNSAELYDPTASTFTPTGSMSVARYYHTATLLSDGRILITGGANSTSGYLSSAEVYDPTTGTFTATGGMITAREFHAATLLNDGRVLITGGTSGSTLSSAESLRSGDRHVHAHRQHVNGAIYTHGHPVERRPRPDCRRLHRQLLSEYRRNL